jgi:hypothetical protein
VRVVGIGMLRNHTYFHDILRCLKRVKRRNWFINLSDCIISKDENSKFGGVSTFPLIGIEKTVRLQQIKGLPRDLNTINNFLKISHKE